MSAHYLVVAMHVQCVPYYPIFPHILLTVPCSSHLRASIWFSCNLLLAHTSFYITVLVSSMALSKCEAHLAAFIEGNSEQSLSLRPRLRFVPVGTVEGADVQDETTWFAAMAKGLPGVLGQMLSTSSSANGFLRRPSLSFVDVSMPP